MEVNYYKFPFLLTNINGQCNREILVSGNIQSRVKEPFETKAEVVGRPALGSPYSDLVGVSV